MVEPTLLQGAANSPAQSLQCSRALNSCCVAQRGFQGPPAQVTSFPLRQPCTQTTCPAGGRLCVCCSRCPRTAEVSVQAGKTEPTASRSGPARDSPRGPFWMRTGRASRVTQHLGFTRRNRYHSEFCLCFFSTCATCNLNFCYADLK